MRQIAREMLQFDAWTAETFKILMNFGLMLDGTLKKDILLLFIPFPDLLGCMVLT